MMKKGLKSAPIDTKVQVSPSARLHEYMKQASDDEDVELMKFEDSESDHEWLYFAFIEQLYNILNHFYIPSYLFKS